MLRFAPSPNGLLHLGHAVSALANETMAAAVDRPMTVRMEDIDRTRFRPRFEAAILEDLAFLAVAWEGPMRRQSAHFDEYREALAVLQRRGLVYPSFATRREIAGHARIASQPRDPDGAPLFANDIAILGEAEAARRRTGDDPAAWRLDMTRAAAAAGAVTWTEVDIHGGDPVRIAAEPALWGDVVLARKEVPTSYHLSVVVDDAAQGITHVVRGEDLFQASAVHRVLQRLLGLPAPVYHHHALVYGPDGRKLSKSNGAESLKALREKGTSAGEIRAAALAFLVTPRRWTATS